MTPLGDITKGKTHQGQLSLLRENTCGPLQSIVQSQHKCIGERQTSKKSAAFAGHSQGSLPAEVRQVIGEEQGGGGCLLLYRDSCWPWRSCFSSNPVNTVGPSGSWPHAWRCTGGPSHHLTERAAPPPQGGDTRGGSPGGGADQGRGRHTDGRTRHAASARWKAWWYLRDAATELKKSKYHRIRIRNYHRIRIRNYHRIRNISILDAGDGQGDMALWLDGGRWLQNNLQLHDLEYRTYIAKFIFFKRSKMLIQWNQEYVDCSMYVRNM